MATWYFNSHDGTSRTWNNPANWTGTPDGTGPGSASPSVAPWKNGSTSLHADDLAMGVNYPAILPQVDVDLGGTGSSADYPAISGVCSIEGVQIVTGGHIFGGVWMGTGLELTVNGTAGEINGGCFLKDVTVSEDEAGINGGVFYGAVTMTGGLVQSNYVAILPPVFYGSVIFGSYTDNCSIICGVFMGQVILPDSHIYPITLGGSPGPGPVFHQYLSICGADVMGGHYYDQVVFTSNVDVYTTIFGGVFLKNPAQLDNNDMAATVTGAVWLGDTLNPSGVTGFGAGNIIKGAVSTNVRFIGGRSFVCAPQLHHVINSPSDAVVYGLDITTIGPVSNTVLVAAGNLTIGGGGYTMSGDKNFFFASGQFDPGAGNTYYDLGSYNCTSGGDTGSRSISVQGGFWSGSWGSTTITAIGNSVFMGSLGSLAGGSTGGIFVSTPTLKAGTHSGGKYLANLSTSTSVTITLSSGTCLGSFTTGGLSNVTISAGTFLGTTTTGTGATLILNGGTLTHVTAGSTSTTTISGAANLLGNLTVTATSATVGISAAVRILGTVNAVCSGVSSTPSFYGTTTLTASGASKTITGGKFFGTTTITATASSSAWTVSGVTVAGTSTFSTSSTGAVTVNGGTILGATTLTASGGAVTVSGGTFRNNVTNTGGILQSGATIYGTVTNASGGTCAARLPLDILNAGI